MCVVGVTGVLLDDLLVAEDLAAADTATAVSQAAAATENDDMYTDRKTDHAMLSGSW